MTRSNRLLLAMALGGCIWLGQMPSAHGQTAIETDGLVSTDAQVSVAPSARDDAIEARLERIMAATEWYADVDLRVREGIVFLAGSANAAAHKQWAQDLAAKTEGVVAVVNKIAVTGGPSWDYKPAAEAFAQLARNLMSSLPLILLALVLLPVFWMLTLFLRRGIRWALASRFESEMLLRLVAHLLSVPIFLVGVYALLQIAGLTSLAVSVLGGAGVFSLILGFAFRDIAENFLSGIILSIRQPFKRGDLISVADYTGIVSSLNARSTILVSLDGNHIIIPNATVFKNTIVNFSSAPLRRDALDVGIGYEDSAAEAQAVIASVLSGHEAVANDPAPMVLVHALGASTVNLRTYFWYDGNVYSNLKLKSALYRLIKRALTNAGISMPDEAREVVFPNGVPIVQVECAPRRPAPDRGPQPPPAPPLDPLHAPSHSVEPALSQTDAEGGLATEEIEAEAQAEVGDLPEESVDMLDDVAPPERTRSPGDAPG